MENITNQQTDLEKKYNICSSCKNPLNQIKDIKCSCGHVVTQREAMLYEMNSRKTKAKESGNSGAITKQIIMGIIIFFIVGFLLADVIQSTRQKELVLLLIFLAFFPPFYTNKLTSIKEKYIMWALSIMLAIAPYLIFVS